MELNEFQLPIRISVIGKGSEKIESKCTKSEPSEPVNQPVEKNYEKIDKALQKFLEPNFKPHNDVYLNLFLTHLVGKKENTNSSNTLINEKNEQLNSLFCKWIKQASDLWNSKKICPSPTILSFSLNLASQLSTQEQIFVNLNGQNVYECLVGLVLNKENEDASVTLGLVTLLCSFLEHKSGVQWVLATTYWEHIINLGLTAHTMYIKKKAYEFTIKLLEKTVSFNQQFCVNLVRKLINPIKEAMEKIHSKRQSLSTEIQNRELYSSLKNTLDFIFDVTETLVKKYNKQVVKIFFQLNTPMLIQKLRLLSQIEDFSYELLRIQFTFLSYKLCGKLEGLKQVTHDSMSLFDIKTMFDLLKDEMDKDHVRCVLKLSYFAHSLYCNLDTTLPLCVRKGETIEFQNQMLIFQLMPIMCLTMAMYTKYNITGVHQLLLTDDFRRDFILKLVKMSAITTVEICFKWKERLEADQNLIEHATFALQYIANTKKLLNKERATICFQPLVYLCKDALLILKFQCQSEWKKECIVFFSTLMNTMIDLVETFDLTWRDSIETISVMALVCEFLQQPLLPDQVVIASLKLLNTAITKYMSPEMVLLMDTTKDSMVAQTGALLYANCHHGSWEIRDSALEVVNTLTSNAIDKFPAFKNIIMDAELPSLVITMALKDGEYYVRATAVRCLHELIRIPEVWEQYLNTEGFWNNILNIFEYETEAIVRKEAATLIYKIEKFQSFPEEMKPRLYDVMTHAATADLHWEVKKEALNFWFKTIETHLNNEGMIDRQFPSHTFSKEQRKIIVLNKTEVRKRIIKVLNRLSDVGCLYVLKCTSEDDCDVEVAEKANKMTLKLAGLFQSFKITPDDVNKSQPSSPFSDQQKHSLSDMQNTPGSPASSTTMTAPSPLSIANLDSPLSQFPNSPFFDPFQAFSAPLSPSFELPTPPNSSSSQLNGSPEEQKKLTNSPYIQDACWPTTNQNFQPSKNDNSATNLNMETYDVDMAGVGHNDCIMSDVENMLGNISPMDGEKREKMLEDFLNSNDLTLLQEIYNPRDQVSNNTTKIKTKTYLAPSEYVKYVLEETARCKEKKERWLSSLDEFDSLLDDILKEYEVSDVNGMDCY